MEIIQLKDNQVIECLGELVQITIGSYEGNWTSEGNTTLLESGERCINDEAYEINGNYYHEEEFDENGIVYDHFHEEYAFEDDCHYGHIGRFETGHFSTYSDYVRYEDEYYLNYEVAESHGIYYCSDCDENYHIDYGCSCSDDDDCDSYCFDYHSGNRRDYSEGSIFKIGFEVEKEDEEARNSQYAFELFSETGWAKEHDGSLGCGGFELISPTLPLDIECPIYEQQNITKAINNVKNYIDAAYSKRCGGHINISQQDVSSMELLEGISGYLPLFYAIYQHRLNNTYSKAKSLKTYIKDIDKYSSFHCKRNGVLEIRIFPAVRNETNLLWRAELLRLILAKPTTSHKAALEQIANPKNSLHQHLTKLFNTQELFSKVKLFAQYAKQFDEINIKQKTVNHNLSKLLKAA